MHPKLKGLVRRGLAFILAFTLCQGMIIPVFADEGDSSSEPPVQDDQGYQYNPADRVRINDVNTLSYKLSTAPSAKDAARKSSDLIISNSTEALSGVESLARFLNYKTMTVEDMKAFEWSFIISQFATPLQDNMADVLNHSIFLQMAQQGLKIQRNPEATSEGLYMDDPYFNDKVVVESDDFAAIAKTIQNNTKYLRLQEDKGSSADPTATDALGNVTLRNICEAPVGTIYYIVDEYYTADGRDKENLFIDRLTILREGLSDDKVHRQQIKIPVLVVTNNVKMYLQANLGAYMKIHSNVVGGEAIPMTYNDLVGTAGSTGEMGGSNLFVDSWGNILVGHDAKYKMLLPNALNPVFTNSDEVTKVVTAGFMNGSSLGTSTDGILGKPEIRFPVPGEEGSEQSGDNAGAKAGASSGAKATQRNKSAASSYLAGQTTGTSSSSPGYAAASQNPNKAEGSTHTKNQSNSEGSSNDSSEEGSGEGSEDPSGGRDKTPSPGEVLSGVEAGDERYTFRYNDRNFAFNKNFVTMYSRQLRMSGSDSWEENKGSIVFLDTYRNGHYQNFLDVKKSVPNSHRNAIIIFDGMRVAYPDQLGDNFAAMLGSDGSFVSPMMYLSKDGMPASEMTKMTTNPDGSGDPMQGILSELTYSEPWWNLLAHASHLVDEFKEFMNSVFGDIKSTVVEITDAPDAELNGLYYVTHPDAMSIMDWFGAEYDDSDLPVRRYFKLCFRRGISGDKLYPTVSDNSFSYVGGDLSTTDSSNPLSDLIAQLDGEAKGAQLAQLFQTYNYMLGVGLNYEKKMIIPDGAMTVDSNDGDIFYKNSSDTGLCFIAKDTFDYAQEWDVFTSGENGMFVREYRPIHTGDEDKYEQDMLVEKKNTGGIYNPKYFRDDMYVYNLRDTRVSDRWINYGVEDVAMISFVWLNYYIPKLLPVRTLVYQADDSSVVSKAAGYISQGKSAYADSTVFKDFREVLNKSYQMTATDTDTEVFGGYTKTTFSKEIKNPTDVIMGPYPELMNLSNYNLYPDAIPMTLNTNHRVVTYSPLELVMGLYRNTAWQYNSSDIPAIQVGSRDVDSTEILATIWDFLKNPVSSIVNILAGGMQMAYNGLAGSNIANIFGATWIKESRLFTEITGMYYFIVGVLIVMVAIYLVFKYVVTKKEKLGTILIRIVKTVALAMVPLIIFNATLGAIGAISNNLLQEPNAKIAAVETELTIRDRFNNDAGYEQYYQAFKQQFDTIVDTAQGFGILMPDYYVEGTNSVIYRHVPLKTLNENLRYANSSVWYDHRGFVPVHKNYYKDSLFYYYYDYIKYQFLYYLAETPQSDLAGQQEFAKRFEFATELQDESGDWLGQGSRGAYINFCDTQLLRSQGAFFTMMRDPNYVYGESIANKASGRWDNAYIQDLFGLTYLFQDTNVETEPFNEFKQSVTWRVFKEHPSFAKVKFQDWATGADSYEFANSAAYLRYKTQSKSELGYPVRDKAYASMTELYRDYKYIQGMGEIALTPLEANLIQLNENIYERVKELVYYDTADMHDEAFIVQAALIATFETNKMFGGMGALSDPIGPVGFSEDSVSLDKIFRVMFAQGINDIAEERNVIYMIVGQGAGIFTASIVLLALACLFVSMLARTLLLSVMGILIVILCIFYYVFRQQHKRKLALGVAVQCGGILGMHLITIIAIRGIIAAAVVITNGLMQFFYATMFLCICIVSMLVHWFLAYCMFKNLTSLGGDMFGYYSELVKAKLDGRLQGKSTVQNTGEIQNSETDPDAAYEEQQQQKLEETIAANNEKAGAVKGAAAVAATALGAPEAAPFINAAIDTATGAQNEKLAEKAAKRAEWRKEIAEDAKQEADAKAAVESGEISADELTAAVNYQATSIGEAKYEWDSESGDKQTGYRVYQDVARTVTTDGQVVDTTMGGRVVENEGVPIPESARLISFNIKDKARVQLSPEEQSVVITMGGIQQLPTIPASLHTAEVEVVQGSAQMNKTFVMTPTQARGGHLSTQASAPRRVSATQSIPVGQTKPIPASQTTVMSGLADAAIKVASQAVTGGSSVNTAGRSANNVPSISPSDAALKPPDLP